jgi:hypothetical protein
MKFLAFNFFCDITMYGFSVVFAAPAKSRGAVVLSHSVPHVLSAFRFWLFYTSRSLMLSSSIPVSMISRVLSGIFD